jgi:hypothetical protein
LQSILGSPQRRSFPNDRLPLSVLLQLLPERESGAEASLVERAVVDERTRRDLRRSCKFRLPIDRRNSGVDRSEARIARSKLIPPPKRGPTEPGLPVDSWRA